MDDKITIMLKSHAIDGDIALMNDRLTWEDLGKFYATALRQSLLGGKE